MATIGLTPVLQTYSILAVALAAGTNLSTSIITLPALLHASPPTLATQWKILYDSGITPVVSLAMSSGLGFATLAYRAAHLDHLTKLGILSNARRNLYVGAALAAFGLAPYTRVLMMGTIEELAGRAEGVKGKGGGKGEGEGEGDGEGKHSTHELVREWGRYNLARGVLLLASAGLGTWASVGRG